MVMNDWQPIETAPKNQSVLVYNGNMFVAWFQDDATDPFRWKEEESDLNLCWCVSDNRNGPFLLRGSKLTHWVPLPESPKE